MDRDGQIALFEEYQVYFDMLEDDFRRRWIKRKRLRLRGAEETDDTSSEEPRDIYAEFARLCGAPADMDRDGQIALFEEYQADFNKPANDFTRDWVKSKKSRLTSTEKEKKKQAPPEAYAAFLRIYLEWAGQDEAEQRALVERSVNNAARLHSTYRLDEDYSQFSFRKGFTTMYGENFEDYVNTVWVNFLEWCSDIDRFAEYLQKNFDRNMSKEDYAQRCQLLFDKMVDNFIKRAEKEWNETIDKRLGKKKDKDKEAEEKLPKELLEDLDADCERRCAELLKIKKRFYETTSLGYPSLRLLLRRPAQNKMESSYKKQQKASQNVSLEADTSEEGLVLEIEDKTKHGLLVEDELVMLDCIERAKKRLDERSKKILDDKIAEVSQKETAKELGMSSAAVSKRVEKIRNIVRSVI